MLGYILGVNATHRVQYLHFLVAQRLGLKSVGRFHRHQGQQLQNVVLEHIPQDAGLVVIVGPVGNVNRLGNRYLHVVNIISVPNRFENGIGKAEHQQILDRLFTQVVVDAEHLVFPKNRVSHVVQVPGRGQVNAKGFLHDHPPPAPGVIGHTGLPQAGYSRSVQGRSERQVIEAVGR